jgi:hypothetical protein
MLTQRIIGAFTFRKGVYAEVENDTTFTTTAWILVVVVAFLNALGTSANADLVSWLIGAAGSTVFAIAGFAVAALVINWVGQAVFNAEVTFDELVRTLGLAYVWNVIGVFGIVSVVSGALACVLTPVMALSALAMIVAWFIATKEALDLEWLQTIVTVVIGFIVMFGIIAIGGLILGLLGVGAASLGGLLG